MRLTIARRLGWACVLACVCAGCSVYDPALIEGLSASGSGSSAAGSGGAGGSTAGTKPPPDMMPTGGTTPPPTGGASGAGGASGMGGMGGTPTTGGTGGSDPGDAQCGGGLKCSGGACVDSTGSPPSCTMGGSECGAYMGSSCAFDTMSMKGACLKSCGATAMFKCPAPLTCKDFFGNLVCQDATGFPPACTVGGTECQTYGLTCSTAATITACWMTCTP